MRPAKESKMKHKPPEQAAKTAEAKAHDVERIPFDQAIRKLASTKPVHNVAHGPAKRNAGKPPKKA